MCVNQRKINEERLDKLKQIALQCKQCSLWESRHKMVFGEGSAFSHIMFVGEAPGRDEDKEGRPFVGRSGKLLRLMISAIDLTPDDWYIANILKCRPPANRDPEEEEMQCCVRFLKKQIEIIQPKLLVFLGRIAIRGLLPDYSDKTIKFLREDCKNLGIKYQNIPVIITYHPSGVLRNPTFKIKVKEDFTFLQSLIKEINEFINPFKVETVEKSSNNPLIKEYDLWT